MMDDCLISVRYISSKHLQSKRHPKFAPFWLLPHPRPPSSPACRLTPRRNGSSSLSRNLAVCFATVVNTQDTCPPANLALNTSDRKRSLHQLPDIARWRAVLQGKAGVPPFLWCDDPPKITNMNCTTRSIAEAHTQGGVATLPCRSGEQPRPIRLRRMCTSRSGWLFQQG